MVLYYAPQHKAYVHVDTDPISSTSTIPASDVDPNGKLNLKFRPQQDNNSPSDIMESKQNSDMRLSRMDSL